MANIRSWTRCKIPENLVALARANDGLAPVDLERFWADNESARKDPFSKNIPQLPLGIRMGDECVWDELGVKEEYHRYVTDDAFRLRINKAYNDKAERIVGKRLLSEQPAPAPEMRYPPVRMLHDFFEARNEWHDRSWWLTQSARDEVELAALLDRVEARLEAPRRFMLPPGWDRERDRLTKLGIRPEPYRWQRGPVTFATSVYGAENFCFLMADNPDLAVRFRDLMLRAMLSIAQVLDEEAGCSTETAPRGFGFADDNCYLMTPAMYELFAYPILKAVFGRYAPNPGDARGQHSDSAMGHLLPILGRLNLTWVNFGPTLRVEEIRAYCPASVIRGQLAPFTFSRNEEEKIVGELLRDFEQSRERRGLLFSTAGSVENGSRLTGMRLIMSAIQHFCRYDL